MLWTPLSQYPELLGQPDIGCSRFVCNYSSLGYRIFILTSSGLDSRGCRTPGSRFHEVPVFDLDLGTFDTAACVQRVGLCRAFGHGVRLAPSVDSVLCPPVRL